MKIGIIGLGSIGSRHCLNLRDMGHTVIVYDPLSAKEPGRDYVLEKSDAIIVASPTANHRLDALDAMELGKPVFVEKPLADRMDSKLSMVQMVGYNLRFHSCVMEAKKWLDEERCGKVLWAAFCLSQPTAKPIYLADGVILNWSHEIDLAMYLLGPAKVRGSDTVVSNGCDVLTNIILDHGDNLRSVVHLDYVTPTEIRSFHIAGEKGTIIVDIIHRIALLRQKDVLLESLSATDTWNDNYKLEMAAFLARIDGKETLGATGKEGLETVKICMKVRKEAGLK